MATSPELATPRLLLRRWRAGDRAPFAALNADPEVMEHFPSVLSRMESDAAVDRIEAHFEHHGFGSWAAEHAGTFIGAIGLAVPPFTADFTPCVEIAWRLARPWWGCGLATEGARAALRFGFDQLKLDEIVAFTVPANLRSRRVMEKLGMNHARDFEHPLIPPGHPLRRHMLYCVKCSVSLSTISMQ